MQDKRPDPQKFLRRAQKEASKETRGRLKIYLGAAPGVGKTYAMLHDAMQEKEAGLDVVIGVVESHGRKEIESILKNFSILNRQVVDYRGKQLLEFDLDAALKRCPGLILMDEMAHTNAPGLRHEKRWQDISELLDRGIDVYTTLNVQHIESLSDDVAEILHAAIKETVPDAMIELANTIELVDIPPEDLLKRLQEGKVYIPEQAMLAAEHFFRKGNLIALRELALRVTAERVGIEVLLYRQDEGIKHIWPTRDKILVCVGSKPNSLKLIRGAKRIATALQATWMAVYVDRPQINISETVRNRAIQNLRFAEQLGAETRVLTGFDIVHEIINFAREQNVTQIIIWKQINTRWKDWFHRNLADEMVRHSGEIDVHIVTGEATHIKSKKISVSTSPIPWKSYLLATCVIMITTLINFFLDPILATSNLIMVYLLGVTVVALLGKLGPSVLASILSVLLFDFFFVSPFYSFAVSDVEYLFTLLIMLTVAYLISHLTILIRNQAESARLIQNQTSLLYTLSRQLSNSRGIDKLLDIGTTYIAEQFDSEVIALLPNNSHLEIRGYGHTNQPILNNKELGIAQWVYELGKIAGFGTETLSFSKALYIPLLASLGPVGVLRIQPNHQQLFTPQQMRLIESCANQIALSLEVDRLQEQAKKNTLKNQAEKISATILQSISHGLRTPLISVLANASTLMELGDTLKREKVVQVGREIYSEAEQLNRLINNLLLISQLESSGVKLQIKPHLLNDIIKMAVNSFSTILQDRRIKINIPENFPLVSCDHVLIQEVILNLLDNAIKFTPASSQIEINATLENNAAIISIEDEGPGIVPDEVNKLFEKFYRGRMLNTERGMGLGLAICRCIIDAHGGKIWSENRVGGGASFRFTLPLH